MMLPVAVEMQSARDQFLSGAAFALDQDCGLGARDFADELAEAFHRRALAEQIVLAVVFLATR